MTIRVLHYTELEDKLDRSGIGTSVNHQRKALSESEKVQVVKDFKVSDFLSPPDVDVLHTNFVGPKTLSVIRKVDLPVVSHAHVTSEDFKNSFRFSTKIHPLARKYLKMFYRQSDVIICPSNYTRELIKNYNTGSRIEVVTNGVDSGSLEGYENLRSEYRDRYDLDSPTVFTLGNVFERKGLSTFVETARRLPEYDFVWFGPYDTGLKASKKVNRYVRNPPDNVTFTGWIDDKRGAFAAGDIYFFPTKEENQGIATLEAMMCQCPVVLNDIPVFRELFEDEYDCLISSSIEEFVQDINRINANKDFAQKIGKNARRTAKEHSLERVTESLESIYFDILE